MFGILIAFPLSVPPLKVKYRAITAAMAYRMNFVIVLADSNVLLESTNAFLSNWHTYSKMKFPFGVQHPLVKLSVLAQNFALELHAFHASRAPFR